MSPHEKFFPALPDKCRADVLLLSHSLPPMNSAWGPAGHWLNPGVAILHWTSFDGLRSPVKDQIGPTSMRSVHPTPKGMNRVIAQLIR